MYTDAMQQVYTNVTKVLVESRQGSNLLYLPLDKVMQMTAQGGAATGAATGSDTSLVPGAASAPAAPSAPATLDARARDASRTRERETR
jgi:membrane protease subunit HflK